MEDSKAKMSILKEMRKLAMDDMGEGLKSGLKKVTVAAPSEDGLKEGLDKAEDMIGMMPEGENSEGDANKDYEDESQAKLQELVDMCRSSEDLDKKIEFLQNAKEEKFGNSSESSPFEEMEE